LLSVVAIMAIIMTVLGMSLSVRGPSTQVAAAQVSSGLSLARQIAISRNAETRFVVYGSTTGATGTGLPQESWRYWTVIRTNRDNPANMWIMEKEWEKLPNGVVFLNIATGTYSPIEFDPIGASVGTPFSPVISSNIRAGSEWTGFDSFGDFNVAAPSSPNTTAFTLTDVPAIGYQRSGEAITGDGTVISKARNPGGSPARAMGLRLADGAVTPNAQILLKSTNNAYTVEADMQGRLRVRARESYR
jgi:Tfp pilus assembly protein FimT